MLCVVAVKAQQFPVAAVSRIVVVIAVLVVNREHAQVRAGEFAPAAPAYPGKEFERLLAIGLFATVPDAPGLGNQLVQPV